MVVMFERSAQVRLPQELLREVNSRIAGTDLVSDEWDTLDFLCECGADGCVATVSLTLSEYETSSKSGLIFAEAHEPRLRAH
jgi:hypothetical protein